MRRTIAQTPFKSRANAPYRDIAAYLCDIFSEAKENDGYVCIRSGTSSHAAQSWMDVVKIGTNLEAELSRHDYKDAFFSFATFKKCKRPHRTIENANAIFAWSIDVDYKNESAHPLDVYEYIASELSLPKPNYVEYGHRLRMIYIFAEPLRLFPKQRDSLLRGFDFLQKCFCEMINEKLGFFDSFGAETNHAATFFRIPFSVNTKDGSVIKIKHVTDERLTLQELFSEWIPDSLVDVSGKKHEWYDKWKNVLHSSTVDSGKCAVDSGKKLARTFNQYELWERRMRLFEQLRSEPSPHRKKLCRLYGDGLVQLGLVSSYSEYMEKVWEFNLGFESPLSEKQLYRHLQWNARHLKIYRYSDQKIADELEIDVRMLSSFSKKEKDAKRYEIKRCEQIKTGKTKAQAVEKRRALVRSLLHAKMTQADIAKKLSVSLATVKRDIKAIREAAQIACRDITEIKKTVSKNCEMKLRKIFLQNFFGRKTPHPRGPFGSSVVYSLRHAASFVHSTLQAMLVCEDVPLLRNRPPCAQV